MCECKSKRPCLDEFMAECCLECGRIWVQEFCGLVRPTDRFEYTPKPMGGVWIGHTFIKDPGGRLARVLRHVETKAR